MPGKNVRSGLIDPEFPTEAVTAIIMVKSDDGSDLLYAPRPVFGDMIELKAALEISAQELKKIRASLEGAIIIPLKLKRRVGLKKEYWDNPTMELGQSGRIKHFIEAVKLPALYQLLVLPEYYDQKSGKWLLSASRPFFITSEDEVIKQYMSKAKDPVDRRAKYAALYQVERPKGMNWATGKIREVTRKDFGDNDPGN